MVLLRISTIKDDSGHFRLVRTRFNPSVKRLPDERIRICRKITEINEPSIERSES